MKTEKQAFLMYYDYRAKLDKLSDAEVREILNGMFEYELTGSEPALSTLAAELVWLFFKDNLDRDRAAYDKRIETQKENGRKGGAPKGNSNAKKQRKQPKQPTGYLGSEKQPKTTQTTQRLKKQPKQPDTDTERDTDTDTDTETDTENERETEEYKARVRALFSSPVILNVPLTLTYEQYEQAAAVHNKTAWLQKNFRHISKIHKFYDDIVTGYYDKYGKTEEEDHGKKILDARRYFEE